MIRGKVVWIDLDDTLWDFKANSRVALAGLYRDYDLGRWFDGEKAWIECYERHNHALWDQYNHALISKEYLMSERFRRPLAEVGSPMTAEYGRLFDREYLDRLALCTVLIDGAIELLESLRGRGCRIGVLSNGFTEVQYRKIRNSGLEPYVDFVVLSDDIGVNKPDVRIFRHAETVCGADATDCIMIGDNPDTDIAGALNAGWQAIYFSRKGDRHPTVQTVNTLRQLF
ncbi:MAG: YjjG family noncanonical pyrimidine nucleotidase [Muribaculaceae bacterium]|nr:YjjG family noncanonical pyrimidine nucleotidase [Muribaculaceae bacterium]